MDAGKDIYRVSLPIAAGVLAASAFSQHLSHMHTAHPAAGICMILLCAVLATAMYFRDASRSALLWVGIFLLLGALCSFTGELILPVRTPNRWFEGAYSAIYGLIEAIPFRHRENNALVRALILGDKSGLGAQSLSNFRDAGASHLLALSGMHLGLIYLLVRRGLFFLGNSIPMRKVRSGLLIAVTGAYTLMCGAGASLMRAWLFILLAESGRILDRPQKGADVFCGALTLHLVFNPGAAQELGFQLSYMAMVGIVFLWPMVRDWYPGGSIGAKIWQLATLSISCQAFTAPLTLWHFGTFPKYFLITNLVAAPLMGVVMVCSLLCMALGICEWAQTLIELLEYPLTALRWLLGIIAGM